jgi:hypothetical protein
MMKMLKFSSSPILAASGWWTAFNKDPKDQGVCEDAAFAPITNIFKKVVHTIIANSKLTEGHSFIDFLWNPNMEPKSADRHNATRAHGYLLVKDISWADVVLSCKYKWEGGDDELDDVSTDQGLRDIVLHLTLSSGRAQVHVEHTT